MAAFDTNLTMAATASEDNAGVGSAAKGGKKAASSSQTSTYASFAPASTSIPPHSSPLLSSTPPTVTKALSQAYPLILAADRVLGILTWTGPDGWQSFLAVVSWATIVLYFEAIVKYLGHLVLVGSIAFYVYFTKSVEQDQIEHPTLDAIVHTLTNVVTRINLFLLPLTSLDLTKHDVTRLIFTTLLISPVYILVTFFLVTPRTLLLLGGVFVLTYHSLWARVTRAILWRSRTVRLATFYMTGIDFSGKRRVGSSAAQFSRKASKLTAVSGDGGDGDDDGKAVRFTYVLYENQRRWLGIGWTANLLAYERSPWTDEFLNESSAPDQFRLPDTEGTGMEWRWVDSTWKLDLTSDGALVPKSKATLTADPGPNEGFIYYDNLWKRPTAEDSYSKFTRRRRWVRTAELVTNGKSQDAPAAVGTSATPATEGALKQRKKSIRFD
jgi:hypothetical protein